MAATPTDEFKEYERARGKAGDLRAGPEDHLHSSEEPSQDFGEDGDWENEIEFDPDPGENLFRKLIPVGLGLVGVAIVGGGILLILGTDKGAQQVPNAIPLIEAETTPEKTKPEEPGGMEIPYQDKLVLNGDNAAEATDGDVERLLPPPEVPQPPAQPEPTVADENAAIAEGAEPVQEQETASSEPESVVTPVTKPEPKPETTKVTEVPKEEAKPVAEQTAAKPVPVKPTAGSYVLQLASLRSQDGAMTEWANLQKKLPKLLGGLSPIVEKADISGVGTRYRLQTGPFETKDTASALCAKLKAAKRDCLVKKVK